MPRKISPSEMEEDIDGNLYDSMNSEIEKFNYHE